MIISGVGFVVINSKDTTPAAVKPVQSQSVLSSAETTKPLDSISSADVAVHVARMTGLHEATAVVNKADSVNAQLAVVTTDESVVAKPQIVGAGLKSKNDIKEYKVLKNDSVTSVAKKFKC